MKTSDFAFDLPDEHIAREPLTRGAARMMVIDREQKTREHKQFADILEYFGKEDVLVLNKSKVIPARINLGGRKEIFVTAQVQEGIWNCMVRPGKFFDIGKNIEFDDGSTAKVIDILDNGQRQIQFSTTENFSAFLQKYGELPLPPYMKRNVTGADDENYQTVFAEAEGSLAAPTAGLHFSEDMLKQLKKNGVQIEYVTLHVGLGTFLPVKVDSVDDHEMHSEWYEIESETAQRINTAKVSGKKITAVGSTALRTLESASDTGGVLTELTGDTDIFLYPPANFKIIDHLLTNFHLPESTLIMLVAAFMSPGTTNGIEYTLQSYRDAIEQKYRFYSYGDATLWW